MDEDIDHAELYAEPACKRIKVNHLMNVFDQVCIEIGAKAILSKQLAKDVNVRHFKSIFYFMFLSIRVIWFFWPP